MKKIFITLIIFMFIFSNNIFAQENNIDINTTKDATINVYFFGTSTCPYCKDEKEFFTEFVKENPDIKVYYFELDTIRDNSRLLLEFSKAFQERSTSVPITFIADKVWIGFGDSIKFQMLGIIEKCRVEECKDSFEYLENKENYAKYLTDKKYVKYLGEVEVKKERIGFFKRISLFFRNLF